MQDMHGKGRSAWQRGTRKRAASVERRGYPRGDEHWMRTRPQEVPKGSQMAASKFTEETVLALRREHAAGGVTIKTLANREGVAFNCMWMLIRGKSWRHVPML